MAGDDADDNQGPMLLAASFTLYSVTLIVYATRIWSRCYPKLSLTAADYTITVAMICKTISVSFMTAAISHGFGKHTAVIPKADIITISHFTFGVFVSGVPASSFARISIACLLLQFTMHRGWRIVIWTTVVLNVLVFLMYEIVQFASCTAVIAANRRLKDSQCLTPAHVWGFTYASVTVSMISDFICATIPLFIIWRLSRSTIEKTLVSILMASSLLASGCGIAKLYYMIVFDFKDPDGLYGMIPEFFWCRMEEAIIIIAACVPLLKCPIERVLRRLGWLKLRALPRELNVIKTDSYQSERQMEFGSVESGQESVRQRSDTGDGV